jgi:hypothetical protein
LPNGTPLFRREVTVAAAAAAIFLLLLLQWFLTFRNIGAAAMVLPAAAMAVASRATDSIMTFDN